MTWDFKERTDRQYKWETYYSPQGTEMAALYKWCWETFGHPGTDPETGVHSGWDSHGGWIKFKSTEELTMFLLRWS